MNTKAYAGVTRRKLKRAERKYTRAVKRRAKAWAQGHAGGPGMQRSFRLLDVAYGQAQHVKDGAWRGAALRGTADQL